MNLTSCQTALFRINKWCGYRPFNTPRNHSRLHLDSWFFWQAITESTNTNLPFTRRKDINSPYLPYALYTSQVGKVCQLSARSKLHQRLRLITLASYWTSEQLVALIYSPCVSQTLTSVGLVQSKGKCKLSVTNSSLTLRNISERN